MTTSLTTFACSWHRYAGKAAYYTGDYKKAQEEHRSAISLNGESLAAWEGLAECQLAAREGDAAAETFEHLVTSCLLCKFAIQSCKPWYGNRGTADLAVHLCMENILVPMRGTSPMHCKPGNAWMTCEISQVFLWMPKACCLSPEGRQRTGQARWSQIARKDSPVLAPCF